MKKVIALAIALVLALGLTACEGSGGTTAPTSGGNTAVTTQSSEPAATQPLPTPAPDDDTVQLSTVPSDNASTSPAPDAPTDGDFLYVMFQNIFPEAPGGLNTQGFFEVDVVFMGDTVITRVLDITEFTVYIDGEPQAFTASNVTYQPGEYHEEYNLTDYRIYLDDNFDSENPPIPFRASELWIEAVINGSTVRSPTHVWNEDGSMSLRDDASVSPPFTLSPSSDIEVGEYVYLGLPNSNYFIGDDSEYDSFYGAHILVKGDTAETRSLDISEFTVYVDGEAQPFNTSNVRFENGEYMERFDMTQYSIYFNDQAEIPHSVSQLRIEAVINGSSVRSQTHDWLEDGRVVLFEDGSTEPPLKVPLTPPLTYEEFYDVHYVKDEEIPDNGTPPTMPEWLESHRGDKGYFYATSDDYIIARNAPFEDEADYTVYSFENGICTEYLMKTVYNSTGDEILQDLFDSHRYPRDITKDFKLIDNVRYKDWADGGEGITGLTKDRILRSCELSESLNDYYEFYYSKS